MDLNRIRQLAGVEMLAEQIKVPKLTPVEDNEYGDSSEFEHAYSNLVDAVSYVVLVLKSKALNKWMKETEQNFSFDFQEYSSVVSDAEALQKSIGELYDKLVKASEE